MTGFGALIKSVGKWADGVIAEAGRGLRSALSERRPKLCPIPVRDDIKRCRR